MVLSLTTILGVMFLVLALASTYLMFNFWGYPYDKEQRRTACPRWKLNVHRAVGLAYLAVYLIMMAHMVPRLWQYQIEFPPRTVAHIILGMTIGVILLVKLSIIRWFRHFEEWMPVLGVGLLLCTVLLLGLSLPFVVRFAGGAGDDGAFSAANRARVRGLLGGAGFPASADLDALASAPTLMAGRRVLLDDCTFCHDLKTAIARPRTPEDWLATVERMAEKPSLGPRLTEAKALAVASYLIAITPELQHSAKAKRAADEERRESLVAFGEETAAEVAGEPPAAVPAPAQPIAPSPPAAVSPPAPAPRPPRPPVDPARARAAFARLCSKCHPADDVEEAPPRSRKAVDALIARMIDNGLEAGKADLALVRAHLIATFVR